MLKIISEHLGRQTVKIPWLLVCFLDRQWNVTTCLPAYWNLKDLSHLVYILLFWLVLQPELLAHLLFSDIWIFSSFVAIKWQLFIIYKVGNSLNNHWVLLILQLGIRLFEKNHFKYKYEALAWRIYYLCFGWLYYCPLNFAGISVP